jgi:sister chromatid cohesion protein PDS5
MDTEEEWIPDEDVLPSLRAKVFALKVCRNRCLALASSDNALENATPALKMFASVLEHNGSLNPEAEEELVRSPSKCNLRLILP